MKLYELPRNSLFTVLDDTVHIPPGAPAVEAGADTVYWFGHIDGMYSYCKDAQGKVLHMAAWTEVAPHNDSPA
jgi:hypothetical protein